MTAEWIEADGDGEACDHARSNADCPILELWDRDRLVVRIEAGREGLEG